MLVDEFLKRYPLIRLSFGDSKHSYVDKNGLHLIGFHSAHATIFRHELAHFVEREPEKVLKYNFGFPEGFGENDKEPDLNNPNIVKAHKAFVYRELRVIEWEKITPISYKEFDGVSVLNLYYQQRFPEFATWDEFTSHLSEYSSNYRKEVNHGRWWTRFHQRYQLLENHVIAMKTKELAWT